MGLVCGTVGAGGGMFSWLELLSSLGVGSSGCGKRMLATCHETTTRGRTRLESVVLGVELCITR